MTGGKTWGFFRGPARVERKADGGDREGTEALPRRRRRAASDVRVVAGDPGGDGRPEVLRPARHVAARLAADRLVRRVGVRRGSRLRRIVDPRLAGDRR